MWGLLLMGRLGLRANSLLVKQLIQLRQQSHVILHLLLDLLDHLQDLLDHLQDLLHQRLFRV